MGAFPEDYRIPVSELIRLWVAEGFLKQPNGSSKSLEEAAEEYLEDLVRRHLILVTDRKFNGKIKSCSLHDMVRETCKRLLEEEKFLRHVTDKVLRNTMNPLSKRSVLRLDENIEGPFEHFRLLRVLHVPKFHHRVSLLPWKMPKLPKLFHLRYLAFTCYRIPPAISDFLNLQTLVIVSHAKLPSSIWKMQQLRHLLFRSHLPHPEGATSALENLQTLKEVRRFENNDTSVLEMIPNLRKLGLYYEPDDILHPVGCLTYNLVHFRLLEKLKIRCVGYMPSLLTASNSVPSSLKKCTFDNCKLSKAFMAAICSLPNLQVLKLMSCSLGLTSWVILGDEFPQLEFLLIDNTEFNILLTEDSSVLPRLKCLRLHNCSCLKQISDDIGEIPTLELIEVSYCAVAVYDWARRVQEDQQSMGNDALRVRCIRGRRSASHPG
ncbi:hypothetical protein C2S51_014842 [Perilla frutescens var. frutescens]|nr:hypothetical protein C2S51_014842 [Perilla frutescens var. frutescens]